IDAQAPALAERLRALAAVPYSGSGWDGRLLEEYALLWLLAAAGRDQAGLPPPLRDTVRSRVGFTVRQADLLASATPVRDRWHVLAPGDLERDGGTAWSTWRELVTASLIGTERNVVPAVAIPGLPPAEDDPGDPAAVLLDRAALLTAARRAGRRPDRAEPLPVCEPDPRPVVSRPAARRLGRILGGEHPDLLSEWLSAAVRRGLRPPAQSLPALLDRARRADPGLHSLVAAAGGPRARWLATLNPDWTVVGTPVLADEDAWRFGDPEQRRSYLAGLRA